MGGLVDIADDERPASEGIDGIGTGTSPCASGE
jgi:hypothetical protein